MKTYFEQQGDFFRVMGSASLATHSREFCCIMAEKLIDEECNKETLPALRKFQLSGSLEHLTELADGLVDTIYVCLHAASSLGIPLDRVWDEVHRSNMAKINPDGTVTRNEFGKVQKPAGWTPPNLCAILLDHQAEKQYGDYYMKTGMVR